MCQPETVEQTVVADEPRIGSVAIKGNRDRCSRLSGRALGIAVVAINSDGEENNMQENSTKHSRDPDSLFPVSSELMTQLGNVINLHTDEHQIWLGAFYASLTTNSLLFIALFTTGKFPQNPLVILFIAMFGCSISLLLSTVQNRAQSYMEGC